jgi:uncharacterized membrane protein HdeD (DUF308 family)
MAGFSAVRALTQHWWVVLLRGILAILFGILAYAWPGVTIAVLVLFWGAYALIDGILAVVAGIRGKWGALSVVGLLGIAAGVVTFLWPGITAITLVWIFAFWAIVAGVLQVSAAIRLRKEVQGEWLWILSGVCMVVLGVLLMLYPGAGALSIIWLIAGLAVIWARAWASSTRRRSTSHPTPLPRRGERAGYRLPISD